MDTTDYYAPGRQLDTAGGALKASLEIIDEGPWPLADMAQLFREAHPKVLASMWATVLLDALSEIQPPIPLAPLARAFNVVALKLNHRPPQIQRKPAKTS